MVTNQGCVIETGRSVRDHPMPRLPDVIRTRRIELGMTQDHLAGLVKVSQTCVARWETGTRVPAGHHLILLLRLLRISYDEVA